MPIGTITTLYCVQHASGTDLGVNQTLASLLQDVIPPWILLGVPVKALVDGIPGVISAIDYTRQDPDDLYMTLVTAGNRAYAVWPGANQSIPMSSGQSAYLGLSVPFVGSQNISLWDYDSVSNDDLLGSVTMLESERGQGEFAKLAKSVVEGSFYYILYRVD